MKCRRKINEKERGGGRRLRTAAARRGAPGAVNTRGPQPAARRRPVHPPRRVARRTARRLGRRLLALAAFALLLVWVWRLSAWAAGGVRALLGRGYTVSDGLVAGSGSATGGTASPSPAAGGWELTLVNTDHPLPADWQVETVEVAGGERVDQRILPALQQLFDAARAQGLYPVVASGYRTNQEQQQILEDKIAAYRQEGYPDDLARQAAAQWVAQPGTSEHELGLAVDINPDGSMGTGQELYDWLLEHAWEYGFIKRYPADKVDITGISNEPWHYRYVGREAARAITDQGLCLEEYLGEG